MSQYEDSPTPVPEHYPYVARRVVHLLEEGQLTNVVDVDIEPDYGYVTRLNYTDGTHRITYGNDLGLNIGAACDLAKDKGHSKFMLRAIGVECPEGEEYLLPEWAERIKQSPRQVNNNHIRTTDQANEYVTSHFGYPVYVKPVSGSKGTDIFKVHGQGELDSVVSTYAEKQVKVAMVEKPLDMPDYRVVTLDGELISAYERVPLQVVGNGSHTIERLVVDLQRQYEEEGRDTRIQQQDPRIINYLGKMGLSLDSIPTEGDSVILAPVSNLSVGGTSIDISDTINPQWVDLAGFVANNFSLRLCGLDLACEDITSDKSRYSVIEVNAAPGLDHYALSGKAQQELVDKLYTRVLNVPGQRG